jgi:hypothetical protein
MIPSGYQVYAVFTMCWILHTLQHGTAVSKPVAVRSTQEELADHWATLIDHSFAWRNGKRFDHLNENMDLIRYTLERSNRFETLELWYKGDW